MKEKTLESEFALVEYLGTEAYIATIFFLSYGTSGKV